VLQKEAAPRMVFLLTPAANMSTIGQGFPRLSNSLNTCESHQLLSMIYMEDERCPMQSIKAYFDPLAVGNCRQFSDANGPHGRSLVARISRVGHNGLSTACFGESFTPWIARV
jgi:hypothetical protein